MVGLVVVGALASNIPGGTMAKSPKKPTASEMLATPYCLRSMLSFIQAWIEEAIARTHSGDDAGAINAMAGLDSMLTEMQQVYRESTLSSGEPTEPASVGRCDDQRQQNQMVHSDSALAWPNRSATSRQHLHKYLYIKDNFRFYLLDFRRGTKHDFLSVLFPNRGHAYERHGPLFRAARTIWPL